MLQYGFPETLAEDVAKVVAIMPIKTYGNISRCVSENEVEYALNGKLVKFPYRIYFNEVDYNELKKLNKEQRMILNCIYSRSCDGFVREKHIRELISTEYSEWTIPYIVKACDEYVVEVVEVVYENLKDKDTEEIKRFCNENREVFCKSYSRMVSYWNEFYRGRCYNFRNYVGRKLFRECFGYSRTMERIKENI